MSGPLAFLVAATLPQAPLSALFLSFLVYSAAGWLWESTVCGLMNSGRFVNSGFLLGPICPIYGAGALMCWLLLRQIEEPLALFLVSGVACCTLEYVVGAALEHATGARFWSYDDKPLNIRGRVCLYGFLLFGAACVLVCRAVEPALLAAMAPAPWWLLVGLALALAGLLLADLVFTMASWRRLSTRLEELRAQLAMRADESMAEASSRMLGALPERAVGEVAGAYERAREAADGLVARLDPRSAGLGAATDMLREGMARARSMASRETLAEWVNAAGERFVSGLRRRDLRFFEAFPRMRMPRYDAVIGLARLRERVRDRFRRKV